MTGFEQDIDRCLDTLQQGGTILYPTDTIWGIGCDATNEKAVQKVYDIKQRAAEKSMIVLLAGAKDILKYVASPDPAVFDYISQLTRPTTLIFDGAIGLAGNLVGADGSIAIRVVREEFCRHLLKRFRKPLVSTSANFSGDPSPSNFHAVNPGILAAADYVVSYRQSDQTKAVASSVIRWNADGSTTIIRQ